MKLHPDAADATPVVVHRDFATYYSPVLKAAFASRFQEGIHQEYRFHDGFDASVIRIFANWLYTQTINFDVGLHHQRKRGHGCEARFKGGCLAKLWVLADQLLIPKLQNEAMRCLHSISASDDDEDLLPVDVCHWVYENTSKCSHLRAWFVETFGYIYTPKKYKANGDKFPQEMLVAMIAEIVRNDIANTEGENSPQSGSDSGSGSGSEDILEPMDISMFMVSEA